MSWRITGSIVCCVASVNFAAIDTSVSAQKHLVPSAWAWTTVGQIVKGVYHGLEFVPTINFDHQWDEQLGAGLRLDATVADRFRARASVEIASYIPFVDPKQNLINPPLRQRIYNIYIDEGYGAYRFGDPGNPFLEVTAGYFTYKYNPQVRNLGEYLFRTGTAPGYIMNFFDWPVQGRCAVDERDRLSGAARQRLLTHVPRLLRYRQDTHGGGRRAIQELAFSQ
jgi:hypothetical protein